MGRSYAHAEAVSFIWSVADLLRGAYKAHDYGKVILPLVVVRRLDCALAPTKQAVLDQATQLERDGIDNVEPVLRRVAGHEFYNTSQLTFAALPDDPEHLADDLRAYLRAFSVNARDIVAKFDFDAQIAKLVERDLLYPVVSRFCDLDLSPDRVSNVDMGYVFEELIRRFSEASNETAGEHFTPREVIRLMVDLLLDTDGQRLATPGAIVSMYDPAAGTGGMLSVSQERLRGLNTSATLWPHGQEINDESYAICKADLLIKEKNADNIAFGNSFTQDAFAGRHFDYVIANPPYGVDWKGYAGPIQREHDQLGFDGRFGPGLPSKSDGQLLFLLHMIAKLKRYDAESGEGGGRLAIVMNGSPLFTGTPGGGESKIRQWIIESDWLEAIVGLPDQLFYNTGIHTYVWIVSNRKPPERRGRVQLIDARDLWTRMRKPLGDKRKEIAQADIDEVVRVYGDMTESKRSKLVLNEAFGFRRVTIERPRRARYEGGTAAAQRLREHPDWQVANVKRSQADRADDILAEVVVAVGELPADGLTPTEALAKLKTEDAFGVLLKRAKSAVTEAISVDDPDAPVVTDAKGRPQPHPDLRGQETVPLPDGYDPVADAGDVESAGVEEYVEREVLPHAPDAWVDESKTKIGYEIPFTRLFYEYVPPRPLKEIDADIKQVESEILTLLRQVTE